MSQAFCYALATFLFGAVASLLLGFLIRAILNLIDGGYPDILLTTGTDQAQNAWSLLARTADDAGGWWIGTLERIGFYFVLLELKPGTAWQVVGAWYALKLASKWEAWSTIGRLPDSPGDRVDPLDYARARRQLAARTYSRFLVGALLNVLSAALLAIVAKFLWEETAQ